MEIFRIPRYRNKRFTQRKYKHKQSFMGAYRKPLGLALNTLSKVVSDEIVGNV